MKYILRSLVFLAVISCADNQTSSKNLRERRGRQLKNYKKKKRQTLVRVEHTLAKNRKKFSVCYRKALRKNVRLQGKITMHFMLMPNGKPQRVGVAESRLPIGLKACLVEALWTTKFRRPLTGRPLKVSLPLNFKQR